MMIELLAAAAGAAPKTANYGLLAALEEGGVVSIATFAILVLMSVGTLFIFFTKLYEQQKVLTQYKKVQSTFWNHGSLQEAAAKIDKDTPYRQIIDDGLRAQDQHTLLIDAQDQHDWTTTVMLRTKAAIDSKLKGGLSFLATVGSTAPFVGLFGTVMGILAALIKIGQAGQASIDTVAGPVGEALYMTAIGLGVAVPAVLAFNWLQGRNKQISEEMMAFVNSIQGWMSSNGAVKPPSMRAAVKAPAKPMAAPAKA